MDIDVGKHQAWNEDYEKEEDKERKEQAEKPTCRS